jgi:tetratricopeptide (TPR) repeat protein
MASRCMWLAWIVSVAVVAVVLAGSRGFVAGDTPPDPGSSQVVQPAAPKGLSQIELLQLQDQMRQIARDEVSVRISSAEKGAIDSASSAMKHNDTTMSYISWVTTLCLGLITLVTAGGVGFLFYGQSGIIKNALDTADKAKNDAVAARDTAVASLQKLQQVEEDAAAVVQRMKAQNDATSTALTNLRNYSASLPFVESPSVAGGAAELPPAEEVMQMEEADILTLLEERTSPTPLPSEKVDRLAKAFVSLGKYWRQIGNYPRAIARFHRATVLKPDFWEGFEGLGRVFVELAQHSGRAPEARERLLALAHQCCDNAERVGGRQAKIVCDLASIEDAHGRYREAIKLYKEAQQLDPKAERLEAYYNPACIYAKEFGEYAEALEEIQKIIQRDNVRELVKYDPDFEEMRRDPNFGAILRSL